MPHAVRQCTTEDPLPIACYRVECTERNPLPTSPAHCPLQCSEVPKDTHHVLPHAARWCIEGDSLPNLSTVRRSLQHCMAQRAAGLLLYTATLRGQWEGGPLQYTATLQGAVGSGSSAKHYSAGGSEQQVPVSTSGSTVGLL